MSPSGMAFAFLKTPVGMGLGILAVWYLLKKLED